MNSKYSNQFQHTAARRRLDALLAIGEPESWVSTHSRPKAAGRVQRQQESAVAGFNTQPPEGGWSTGTGTASPVVVSTHSRPKAAGTTTTAAHGFLLVFQHTAARRRLGGGMAFRRSILKFQHTAARRRLELSVLAGESWKLFQHTAARRRLVSCLPISAIS